MNPESPCDGCRIGFRARFGFRLGLRICPRVGFRVRRRRCNEDLGLALQQQEHAGLE